jgi:hypothetical protein
VFQELLLEKAWFQFFLASVCHGLPGEAAAAPLVGAANQV